MTYSIHFEDYSPAASPSERKFYCDDPQLMIFPVWHQVILLVYWSTFWWQAVLRGQRFVCSVRPQGVSENATFIIDLDFVTLKVMAWAHGTQRVRGLDFLRMALESLKGSPQFQSYAAHSCWHDGTMYRARTMYTTWSLLTFKVHDVVVLCNSHLIMSNLKVVLFVSTSGEKLNSQIEFLLLLYSGFFIHGAAPHKTCQISTDCFRQLTTTSHLRHWLQYTTRPSQAFVQVTYSVQGWHSVSGQLSLCCEQFRVHMWSILAYSTWYNTRFVRNKTQPPEKMLQAYLQMPQACLEHLSPPWTFSPTCTLEFGLVLRLWAPTEFWG